MIYSYTISENFLNELSSLDLNLTNEICNFINNSFIKKENLYLKIDRSILKKKYGSLSNEKFDKLIKKLSNENKDVLFNKPIPIDFAFIAPKEKGGKINLTCDLIIKNQEKIEEELEKRIVIKWPLKNENSDKLKYEKLQSHFKRILQFNNSITIYYRYLLLALINQKENEINNKPIKKIELQLESYKLFVKFLSDIRNNFNTTFKFIFALHGRQLSTINKIKFNCEAELKEFFKSFLRKDDELIVKDGTDQENWDYSHGRYLVSFLDFKPEKEILDSDSNIFESSRSFQLFGKNNTIYKGNHISRLTFMESNYLLENDLKNLDNSKEITSIKNN